MIRLPIFAVLISMLVWTSPGLAQEKKAVSLEDVFKKGTFNQKSVGGINWMKDGQYYTSLISDDGPKVVKINVSTGEQEAVLIDGGELGINFSSYSFNNDETKALIISER